jgi:hypothetical protein
MLDNISKSIRAQKDFDLHCHSMILATGDKDMPKFRGPGAIRIGSRGNLQFTIYADSLETYPLRYGTKSGELIPDDPIYRLTAIDQNETEWISDVVPNVQIQPTKGLKKAVVTGDLIDIHCREPMYPDGLSAIPIQSDLTLYVFDSIDIPLNTSTETQIKVNGELVRGSGAELNIAKVEVDDHKFSFTHHDDLLEIQASAPTLAAALDKRIIESLQFILARPIWWTILHEESGDTTFSRIRSAPRHATTKNYLPPIDSVAYFDQTNCVWKLYAKYFECIRDSDQQGWHPLSRFVYSAIEARIAGFDTYRLALGVAIEGILKTAFENVFTPSRKHLDAVEGVVEHLKDWRCQFEWEEESTSRFRKRIMGAIAPLRNARPLDQLKSLADLRVVAEDELRAWKSLRNKTAHADQPDGMPSQKELKEVLKVTTMMHKLVFQAIGYSGKYNDYGKPGFPLQHFEFVPFRY